MLYPTVLVHATPVLLWRTKSSELKRPRNLIGKLESWRGRGRKTNSFVQNY